jgi:hypothetical protein
MSIFFYVYNTWNNNWEYLKPLTFFNEYLTFFYILYNYLSDPLYIQIYLCVEKYWSILILLYISLLPWQHRERDDQISKQAWCQSCGCLQLIHTPSSYSSLLASWEQKRVYYIYIIYIYIYISVCVWFFASSMQLRLKIIFMLFSTTRAYWMKMLAVRSLAVALLFFRYKTWHLFVSLSLFPFYFF